jgi:hypothetical protein
MPIPIPNTAMVEEALNFLTSAYASDQTPVIQAFLAAFVTEIQLIENATQAVINGRSLASIPAVLPLSIGAPYGPSSMGFYTQISLPMTLAPGTYAPGTIRTGVDIFPGETFSNVLSVTATANTSLVWMISGTLKPSGTSNDANVVFDMLGALVGQPRSGLNDHDYRAIIYLKVAVNRSDSSTSSWSSLIQILLQTSGGPVEYTEASEAGFDVFVGDMSLNPLVVASVLSGAVPNGVGANLLYSTWPDGNDFEWCDSSNVSTTGQGTFGDSVAGLVGGLLISAEKMA